MKISSTFERLHLRAKQNSWLWLFSIFCRFSLAAGFIPAGIVKIVDERFASGLSVKHPMGSYLEALHHTGFYYTFIGVVQILAAVFLLIPRTVTLGAFLYFPVILNICILTYAVRFDGSLFTAPLMTLANLYLLGWNYEKWKYILPFNHPPAAFEIGKDAPKEPFQFGIRPFYERFRNFISQLLKDKFPWLFFAGVFAAVAVCVVGIPSLYRVKPRNTVTQCQRQFKDSPNSKAGEIFCNCIHENGEPLDKCLNDFNNATPDSVETQ